MTTVKLPSINSAPATTRVPRLPQVGQWKRRARDLDRIGSDRPGPLAARPAVPPPESIVSRTVSRSIR